METTQKSTSLMTRILNGEQVTCEKCRKGIYRPFNPKAKVNHCYVCDHCGDGIHWDPVVIVE